MERGRPPPPRGRKSRPRPPTPCCSSCSELARRTRNGADGRARGFSPRRPLTPKKVPPPSPLLCHRRWNPAAPALRDPSLAFVPSALPPRQRGPCGPLRRANPSVLVYREGGVVGLLPNGPSGQSPIRPQALPAGGAPAGSWTWSRGSNSRRLLTTRPSSAGAAGRLPALHSPGGAHGGADKRGMASKPLQAPRPF